MNRIALHVLLGLAVIGGTALAQEPTATAAPGALSGPGALSSSASRGRDDAQRALFELKATGGSTAEIDLMNDLMRRAEDAFRAGSFAESSALFQQALASARRSKNSRDQAKQAAKVAESRAIVSFDEVRRQVGLAPTDPDASRIVNVAAESIRRGKAAENAGNFSEAQSAYNQASGFLRRMIRANNSADFRCDSARSNFDRVLGAQRRIEAITARGRDSLALELTRSSKRLLDESRRLLDAGICDESLRNSRLAENIMKRAAERFRAAR